MIPSFRFILVCLIALTVPETAFATTIHHRLHVRLDPQTGALRALDTLTLPEDGERFSLEMHAGLSPHVVQGGARLTSLGRTGHLERFALQPEPGEREIALGYAGRIRHDMQEIAESPGRSHQSSIGTISAEGVFLSGNAGWYPWIPGTLQRFTLTVELPAGWMAVSQGAGPKTHEQDGVVSVTWQEPNPQDDIYLIAAPFRMYRRSTPVAEAQIYLRQADPELAERYLTATARYLSLYDRLLGDYPYGKFALVENFWATGYGMPSFTLLGSRVIRLPFIINTSYPHEILHNWWGNGVYVDSATGNWGEGITTYLADHLLQEQRGRGAAYRRDALQRFADYVRGGDDIPLTQFRGRHSSASQSVGYGKGFMLFHMLRRELGDRVFIDGLRRFYREHRFKIAGYADLRQAFEQTAGRDLAGFFAQWLERSGAPTLAVSEVTTRATARGYRVAGTLRQTQSAEPFALRVPIVVHRERGVPLERNVNLAERETRFELELAERPLRLDVDPRFDLFRTLYPEESPATLGALFGSERGLMLLPAAAEPAMMEQYRELAQRWTRGYDGWQTRSDREFDTLPDDRPVWIIGWENRFLTEVAGRLQAQGAGLTPNDAGLESKRFSRKTHSIALTAGGARSDNLPVAWLGAHDPDAVTGLARKLPHYGKYGFLVFTGSAPDNVLKGQWPVRSSPLSVALADAAPKLELGPAPALTDILYPATEQQGRSSKYH